MERNADRIRRRLLREGWFLARQGRNHEVYHHPDVAYSIQLPRHREVSSYVARSIAKAAGWDD